MTRPELPDTPTDEQITDYLTASYTYRTAKYPTASHHDPVDIQRLDIVVARDSQDVVIVCARCREVILDGAFYDIVAELDHRCDNQVCGFERVDGGAVTNRCVLDPDHPGIHVDEHNMAFLPPPDYEAADRFLDGVLQSLASESGDEGQAP